jgi:hypothetical protein
MDRFRDALSGLQGANSPENSGPERFIAAIGRTWPAACIISGAISISQLVLNEIAWSPGDPGTGAPSFFTTVMSGLGVRLLAAPAA